MSESNATLETAVNFSSTRQHYTLTPGGERFALCDTDAIPVRVMTPKVGDDELPFCRRCVSIARRQGLMPQEA